MAAADSWNTFDLTWCYHIFSFHDFTLHIVTDFTPEDILQGVCYFNGSEEYLTAFCLDLLVNICGFGLAVVILADPDTPEAPAAGAFPVFGKLGGA